MHNDLSTINYAQSVLFFFHCDQAAFHINWYIHQSVENTLCTKPTLFSLSSRFKVYTSIVEPFLTFGTLNHLVSCVSESA